MKIIKERIDSNELFMREALKEARIASEKNEVPIGAVIVSKNSIIARAHNLIETLSDVTAHAEMQCYTSAANYLGSKYLKGCTLFVTLEPCVMCAGAAFWTQIDKIVFGATDKKRGYSLVDKNILHPKTEVISGILEDECSQLIKDFFEAKR